VRPDYYRILSRLVEAGAQYGVRRAFKHTDNPELETIIENVEREIMTAISEEFIFDDRSE